MVPFGFLYKDVEKFTSGTTWIGCIVYAVFWKMKCSRFCTMELNLGALCFEFILLLSKQFFCYDFLGIQL